MIPAMNRPLLTTVLALGGGLSLTHADSLTLSGGALLNVRADFGGLGVLGAVSNPGPVTGGAVTRTYDNGFVGVDVTGNGGDTTWNWGYQNAAQVQGGNLVFQSDTAAGTTVERNAGKDAHASVELAWRKDFGEALGGRWGLLLGVGLQQVDIRSGAALAGGVTRTSDAYSLNGLPAAFIPTAPYSGSAAGPGPLISSVPSRTVSTVAGALTVTGLRELDTRLVPFALGPSLEWDLGSDWSATLAGGALLTWAEGDFRFTESSTVPGRAPQTALGAASGNDWLFGGFVEAGLHWGFRPEASLDFKVRWQALEDYLLVANGRYGRLDLEAGVQLAAGLSWRF